MKKYILISAIVLFSNLIIGQSIVDTTKQWHTLIQGPPYNPMPDQHTETIIFQQDTIIDGKTYRKVFRSLDEFMTNWEEYCFIRETADKKVYMRSDTSSQEYLLYDMGAAINDTLWITGIESYMGSWSFYSHNMVVTSIDSILIGNTYRERINLNDSDSLRTANEEWIDGMGSMSGILHNASGLVGGDWFELLCFEQNDSLIYQNPNSNSCFLESTNIENQKNITNDFYIYPNPSTSNFTILLPENSKGISLTIANTTGQLIQVIPLDKGQTVYQYTGKLSPGTYFIGIDNGKKTMLKRLVVK